MSASTQADLLVAPAFWTHPAWDYTLGDEVADLCSMVGFAPDPEQRLLLDGIFGYNRTANGPRSAAFKTTVVAPRQNIKTGLFKQCALGWLFLEDQRLVTWSAHEFSTTAEAFRDLKELIDGSDLLTKRVKRIYEGSGAESVHLNNGCRLRFKARTKTGGRGLTGNKTILDEGFALKPTHMGAVIPVMSTVTNAQVVIGSSAGLIDSEVLRGLRDEGRKGSDRSIYCEWCDDLPGTCTAPDCSHRVGVEGCILDDVDRWARGNTQLAHGEGREHRRISVEYVRDERSLLTPEEFWRERMGKWDEPAEVSDPFVLAWPGRLDAQMSRPTPPQWGLAVSTDRAWATVAASDGAKVEIAANRQGTGWVVAECQRLTNTHGGSIALNPSSPAGSLLKALLDEGIPVLEVGGAEWARACGKFHDAVMQGGISHRGDPELDLAVRKAVTRPSGETWVWSQTRSPVDIGPLCAAALAAFHKPSEPRIRQLG